MTGTGRFSRGPAPTVDNPGWVPFPEVTVTLPDDGKVTGAITLTFTGEHVSARTEGAHVNDENLAVAYRGESFLVHVGVYLEADGSWSANRDRVPHVTRRASWSDAPPSFRAAIVAAVEEAVNAVASVSPELVRAGRYASAMQALSSATRDLAELDAKRRDVRKVIRAERARVLANMPEVVTAPTPVAPENGTRVTFPNLHGSEVFVTVDREAGAYRSETAGGLLQINTDVRPLADWVEVSD
jgi:hypothetical protein